MSLPDAGHAALLAQAAPLASCQLPTRWGLFTLHGLADAQGREHAALSLGDVRDSSGPVLVRLHSECLTGDAFGSLRCDCGPQRDAALQAIAQAGRGVLLYLRQEGRGIGLVNKIRAYALQQAGADTVDANRALGLPDDARDYRIAAQMLSALGVHRLRLLTNNPAKVAALRALGLQVDGRVPLQAGANPHNQAYLHTKARRMGHWLTGQDAAADATADLG